MLKGLIIILLIVVCVECEVKKPNFVIVLTDDQDAVLKGMVPMKNVKSFIGDEGTTFTNSVSFDCPVFNKQFVTSPICCPSRSSILTGLYVHNHKTKNNSISGGCYSKLWREYEKNTFATALMEAGYNTFYAGKYLNQYGVKEAGGPERVPPGWSEWHGLVGNSVYYNYTLSNNGIPTQSADHYLTDVIRDLGVSFIENQTESGPFLMVLAPPAPHQPFTPAPRHRGVYGNVTVTKPPNFNVAVQDRHWLMSMPPSPLPESMIPELDHVYRSRWEALLAVDEMVADVVNALETKEMLDDTYIVYTSDNGYHIGQFSQVYDKRQPYESDIRVPFLIRGPGVPKNCSNSQPILNVDLAPTIISLAGLTPKDMDGRPIDLTDFDVEERHLLVEYHGEGRDSSVDPLCPWKYDGDNLAECYPQYECKCQDAVNNTYACLRHFSKRLDYKYCYFVNQTEEIYDLSKDPFELSNVVDQVFPAIRHWYQLLLARKIKCRGVQQCESVTLENINSVS